MRGRRRRRPTVGQGLRGQVNAYIGTPEDVAEVIVFLASEAARWVTGQKIYVGGVCKEAIWVTIAAS